MNETDTKELLGRLEEISETLIKLQTFFEESGIKDNLSSISKRLKKIEARLN
ncbi:hypothetical protein LRS05_13680 [Flavobacterium sp. J372]|uniref:hypothetical protein n=1 Tax=Flavobacterium sp. J372 TaxID=2898436 RepID=UPI002151C880|nr:hypothetical protein [Flavobacterium sp. J372]MCR5863109.1 hypothetical protein [Flavobacterium sp. J372]